MICYFDSSAVIPMLIAEPSSRICRQLWIDADAVATTRMLYVEGAAALAQAERLERITSREHRKAIGTFERLWREFLVIEAVDAVVRRAAEIAYIQELRGYDAIHCASAETLPDSDLLIASGDRKLLQACRDLGLSTADVNPN